MTVVEPGQDGRSRAPRVAVIGARGIGRHHARWFHLEGADVIAIAGSNSGRLVATADELRARFPFAGRAYADVSEMLRREAPNVVVVASPPELHVEHCRLALESGADVYLEKPFMWDDARPADGWLAEARAILDRASERGLLVGVNTQYAAAWEPYAREFAVDVSGARSLLVEFDSASLARERQFGAVWVDLGSHPISIMLEALPGGRVVPGTAKVHLARHETTAAFEFGAEARALMVSFHCRSIEAGPVRRRFGVDDVVVACELRTDASGRECTVLRGADREYVTTDLMHESIRRFLRAVRERSVATIVATGETGLRNLEIQAELADLGRRRSS